MRRFGLVFSLVLGYPKFGEVLRQPAGVLASDATGRSSIRPLAFCDDSLVISSAKREHVLGRIRALCLALPETSERLSHGAPTFFVRGKRAFLMVLTNHHGDGRFAIWCAAPEGMQRLLADTDPEKFFVPPYVGHRGWLGVRLDRGLDWNELAGIVEDAYAEVAPAKLVAASASESTQYRAGRTKRRG